MSRNGNAYNVAAPLLGNELVLGELLHYLVGGNTGLIHLVNGHNDLNVGGAGMIYGLYGLGHNSVVGGHDKNCNVGGHGASRTHGGEGSVTGGVEEGDVPVAVFYAVCADMLGNSAGLGGGDVGLSDCVKNGGLTVVNVSHNNHNGASGHEIFLIVHRVVYYAVLDGDNYLFFHNGAHFGGDDCGGVIVDNFVDRRHNTQLHKLFYDLCSGLFHAACKLADRNFVADGDLNGGLFDAFKLNTAKLVGLGLHLGALFRAAVILGTLIYLLLSARGITVGTLGGKIGIFFIVFIKLDLRGTGVDVADGAGAAVGSDALGMNLFFLFGLFISLFKFLLGLGVGLCLGSLLNGLLRLLTIVCGLFDFFVRLSFGRLFDRLILRLLLGFCLGLYLRLLCGRLVGLFGGTVFGGVGLCLGGPQHLGNSLLLGKLLSLQLGFFLFPCLS